MEKITKCKKYLKSFSKNKGGFTLLEVSVSLAVVSLLMLGFYEMTLLSLKVTADNSYIVEATEIGNERMEKIRNLKYDDVGTQTGSPHGVIPEHETVTRSGTYDVHTMIIFYDDPYDGTLASGTDSIFVDYKIVTIDVSWQGRFGPKKITVFSKVVPNTEETLSGYGLLKLITVDAGGAVVPNASIHINNASTSVNADYESDNNGQFYIALLPSFEGYEVTVTKTGYSTEKTYARDAINLNPTKVNLSVYNGVKTEESFSIDHLADFTVRTVANNLQSNWRVNASTTPDSVTPRISIDQNDNAYFAWQRNGAATSTIWVQKYNSANVKQWASEVSVSTSSFQASPDIATTKAGVSYVVWQDNSTNLKLLAYDTSGHNFKLAKTSPTGDMRKNEVAEQNQLTFFSKIKYFFNSIFNSLWRSMLAFGHKEIKTQPAEAVLTNVAIVQTQIGTAVNNSNSATATFTSTPKAGDVLIAIAVNRNAGHSFNAPTNTAGTFATSSYSDSSNSLDVGIWHKVAGASEPKQVTITMLGGSNNISGGVLMIMEVSGLATSSLLNVTAKNDQTGSNGTIASTGLTATSTASGFAIAASAFADDSFNAPTDSSWTSSSSNSFSQQLWTNWTTGNDGFLAVASMNVNAAAKQQGTLKLTGGSNVARNSVLAVFNVAPLDVAIVSASGNQNASAIMPLTDYYLGGKFVITENNSSRNVNSVKLQEFGTVDAQAKISAIKLFYDLDTSAPYDCASETYNPGSDPEFGSATTFNGADGFATTTQAGGVNITTTKALCLYPVVSLNGANNGDTVDVKINNPSTDVKVSTGSTTPTSTVDIAGSTTLFTPADVRQVHARLRNDDGNEANASWAASQDTSGSMYISQNLRLRFEMSNRGGTSSAPMSYRLEYGALTTSCDSIATWHAVPTDNSLDWKMADSTYFTDGTSSTNVANGLTDDNLIFVSSQLKDTGNQTAALALGYTQFTEMEYNIKPNTGAGDQSYCFRLTDQGNASQIIYEQYAVVYVKGDENIFMRAISANGSFAGPIKRVNTDMSNARQTNPVIALTENFGTATTAVAWEDDRNGNSDIYLEILDASGNRLLPNDLHVADTLNNEYSPTLAFDSQDNLYVAWVENAASQEIYMSKYDINGNLISGRIALKTTSDQEYSPKISFDATDNLYLIYTKETGGIKKVLVAKYNTSLAQVWEKNPNVESMTSNQYSGSLGIYGSTMYAIWNDDRNTNKDVYAQKIDASGNPLWANDLKVNIGLDTADQLSPDIAVRSGLTAVGVWQDNRSGRSEVYASEFTDPASVVGAANVPLEITGTKRIGENPVIYKYNQVQTTDASGYLHLQVDWDVPGYSVAIHTASSSKSIILRNPPQPLNFLPSDNKTMLIYVQ